MTGVTLEARLLYALRDLVEDAEVAHESEYMGTKGLIYDYSQPIQNARKLIEEIDNGNA